MRSRTAPTQSRGQWVGTDPRLGDKIVVAETKEEAEVDLKLLIAAWDGGFFEAKGPSERLT
jgi:hypothetical protein